MTEAQVESPAASEATTGEVLPFPSALRPAMELTAEQSALLDKLEAENTAASETFRQAYTTHTQAMHDLEMRRKALWDDLAVQFNLDKTKPYQVDLVDGKRILSEMPVANAPAPGTQQ